MSSPSFTCNSCVIQFQTSDSQRYHMKTEWHRYNLKRRVADLPPISAGMFAEKVQISEREQKEHQVDEFGFAILKSLDHNGHKQRKQKKKNDKGPIKQLQKEETENELHRTVSSTDSVTSEMSHLTTSEYNTTDFGEDTASEYGFTSDSNYDYATSSEDDTDDEEDHIHEKKNVNEFSVTQCIYCGSENKDIERNLRHMFRSHGLYIPERSYLVDLDGLLKFLINQMLVEFNCMCCNYVGSSLESTRAHMDSKRHCKLPYETKEEREVVAQFYDFSSLEEAQEHEASKNTSEETNEADDDDDSGINSNYTVATIDESGSELTLPTGVRLGHRGGQRYYRQNLPLPPDQNDSRRTVTAADRRMISGVTEKQYKKGMKKMQLLEQKAASESIRKEVKRVNFQPHFRDPLLQ
ncbi:Cytoplasmic 60S subunit biogenesis factor REH1 [Nakaseomyces bracarensis]|uniref:Cytoplasmic 60S subunit biogenesis factor REH1 n=1 Tax=Nakaseomyces bracarensis TaxID=273131 RepID=A0ABR4NWY2_9SACH